MYVYDRDFVSFSPSSFFPNIELLVLIMFALSGWFIVHLMDLSEGDFA